MNLFDLPAEILLEIFLLLDDKCLASLKRVSKTLKKLIDDDHLWQKKFQRLTIYNPLWYDYSNHSWETNYVACQNWRTKALKPNNLVRYNNKYLPWLRISDDQLYISRGSLIERREINKEKRRKNRRDRDVSSFSTVGNFDDIGRFAVSRTEIFAGTLSGQICVWKNGPSDHSFRHRTPVHCFQAHSSDLHSVAVASSSTVITGSRDEHVKFWNHERISDNDVKLAQMADLWLGDRVWSMHVEESCQRLLSVGSAACKTNCAPVTIFDIEHCSVVSQLGVPARKGAGVCDVKFRNETTLLACGYESMTRLYDLRSNKCEWQWWEKYDSSIFCLETDNNNSVIVGTSRHGLVWFLDLRWSKPVRPELFSCKRNSPVYSLAANTTSLFVGLDSELNEFSVK